MTWMVLITSQRSLKYVASFDVFVLRLVWCPLRRRALMLSMLAECTIAAVVELLRRISDVKRRWQKIFLSSRTSRYNLTCELIAEGCFRLVGGRCCVLIDEYLVNLWLRCMIEMLIHASATVFRAQYVVLSVGRTLSCMIAFWKTMLKLIRLIASLDDRLLWQSVDNASALM